MTSFASALLLLMLPAVGAMTTQNFSSDQNWVSVSESMEFLPADIEDESSPALRRVQQRMLNYYQSDMVDGMETQYNEYAQSWRLLGFYTECQDNAAGQGARRRLEDAAAQDNGQGNDDQAAQEYQDAAVSQNCQRYLLWGAVRY
jgi:hypothetical protein